MCGRYTNQAEFSDVRLRFQVDQLELFRDWRPSYNIAPSYGAGFEQLIVVAGRAEAGTRPSRVLRLARWWLIPPHWGRPLRDLPTAFNARAEEVSRKPLWREAFRSARCLVPATGWREFQGSAGHKQPYHFHQGGQLFAFAGLWSRWQSPEGQLVDSFALLTTEPHPVAAEVHDRMPLVLMPELYDAWLDPREPQPDEVLRAACAAVRVLPVEVYASDAVGNRPGVEGPEVIAPATPARFEQQNLFGSK